MNGAWWGLREQHGLIWGWDSETPCHNAIIGLNFLSPHTPLFLSRIRSLIGHRLDCVLLYYPNQATNTWPFGMKYHLISIVPRAKWIDPTSPENVVEERGSLDLAVRSEVACQHAQILVVSPEPRARGREVSQIANSNTLNIFTQYWLVVACTFVTNSFGNAVSYLLSSLPYLNWLRSGF